MTPRRTLRLLAAAAAAALILAACGGDDANSDSTSTTTTITLAPFTTLTPATTPPSTTPTTAPPATDAAETATTTYTVEAGDSLFAIAERFDVTLDALVEANGWPDGIDTLILPGDVIQLPSASAPSTTTATDSTEASASAGYGPPTLDLGFTDGRTLPITEPLADGVYFSDQYAVDGGETTFRLTQYFVCDGTELPAGVAEDCASGFATLSDPSVSLDLSDDATVTINTGDLESQTRADVTTGEFARLVAGEEPAADAPEDLQFVPWLTLVEVRSGSITGVQQIYTS